MCAHMMYVALFLSSRMNESSSTDPFQLPKESYPFLLAAKKQFSHQLLPRECYSHRMCTVQPPATRVDASYFQSRIVRPWCLAVTKLWAVDFSTAEGRLV
ncbi:hypothetical protein VPH35_053643 [Triticum aestivum]